MTTSLSTSVVDQSTDAGFRAWIVEWSAKLATVGLVQTADTGQINPVTVTRALANTAAGYEIWRFADSSFYIKFEYGSGAANNWPQMWSTMGTGSNGTGTITGTTDARAIFTGQSPPVSLVTNYTSRWCHTADAFSASWKELGIAAAANMGYLVYGKSVGPSGAAITTGFARIRHGGISASPSKQCVRTVATAVAFNDLISDFIVCGDPNTSSTASTGAQQAYQIPMNIPDVIPYSFACLVLLAEAARGATFVVNMVGSTNHTYISPGQISNVGPNAYTVSRYTIAMIWE